MKKIFVAIIIFVQLLKINCVMGELSELDISVTRKLLYLNSGKLNMLKDIEQKKEFYRTIIEMHKKKLIKKYDQKWINANLKWLPLFGLSGLMTSLLGGNLINQSSLDSEYSNKSLEISTIFFASTSLLSSLKYYVRLLDQQYISYKLQKDEKVLKELNSL